MAKFKRVHIFPSPAELDFAGLGNSQLRETISKPLKLWADKLIRTLDTLCLDIAAIPFNQSEYAVVADTGTANTEFTVTHTLKRVPSGFILVKTDKAVGIYDSGTAWTDTAVYLKASAANAAITLMIF